MDRVLDGGLIVAMARGSRGERCRGGMGNLEWTRGDEDEVRCQVMWSVAGSDMVLLPFVGEGRTVAMEKVRGMRRRGWISTTTS